MFLEIQVFKFFLCACAANDADHRRPSAGARREAASMYINIYIYIYYIYIYRERERERAKFRAIELTRKLASLAIIY